VSHISPSAGGPVPSLVGSLSVFDLSRVLSWLASGAQTGELRIEGRQGEGRIWLMQGQLSNAQVGTANTIGQAVFELARIDDGTFQYTEGPVSSSGEALVPVAGILAEVSANVEEWRAMRRVIPAGATVALCPNPPDHDVKIRSDQWRLLTHIGAGDKTVEQVIETGGGDQIVALRALRDLHVSGLITVQAPAETALASNHRAGSTPDGIADITPLTTTGHAGTTPADELRVDQLSDDPYTAGPVEFTGEAPPPPATDPWSTLAGANGSSDNGVA
jgi:hypothetical protein